jgi:hypothetical protein
VLSEATFSLKGALKRRSKRAVKNLLEGRRRSEAKVSGNCEWKKMKSHVIPISHVLFSPHSSSALLARTVPVKKLGDEEKKRNFRRVSEIESLSASLYVSGFERV